MTLYRRCKTLKIKFKKTLKTQENATRINKFVNVKLKKTLKFMFTVWFHMYSVIPTSPQQVVVMEFGKRHDTTDNEFLSAPTCY